MQAFTIHPQPHPGNDREFRCPHAADSSLRPRANVDHEALVLLRIQESGLHELHDGVANISWRSLFRNIDLAKFSLPRLAARVRQKLESDAQLFGNRLDCGQRSWKAPTCANDSSSMASREPPFLLRAELAGAAPTVSRRDTAEDIACRSRSAFEPGNRRSPARRRRVSCGRRSSQGRAQGMRRPPLWRLRRRAWSVSPAGPNGSRRAPRSCEARDGRGSAS